VLLVVAALAMFFVPAGMLPHWGRSDVEVVAEAASAASDAGTVAGAAAPAPATAAAGSAPPAAGSAAAVAPAGPAAAADPVAASAVPTDEVLAHAAAPVGVPVLVKASADTWIEVTDAQGHALLSRTVVAGESVGLDGAMPMRVKIGNAAATVLSLRGDNVDLNPWTRDNVARLELK